MVQVSYGNSLESEYREGLKLLASAGMLLVAIGIIGLAYPSFDYTTREEVLRLGPFEATAERQHSIPVPPVVCWIFIVGGAGTMVFSAAKRVKRAAS